MSAVDGSCITLCPLDNTGDDHSQQLIHFDLNNLLKLCLGVCLREHRNAKRLTVNIQTDRRSDIDVSQYYRPLKNSAWEDCIINNNYKPIVINNK